MSHASYLSTNDGSPLFSCFLPFYSCRFPVYSCFLPFYACRFPVVMHLPFYSCRLSFFSCFLPFFSCSVSCLVMLLTFLFMPLILSIYASPVILSSHASYLSTHAGCPFFTCLSFLAMPFLFIPKAFCSVFGMSYCLPLLSYNIHILTFFLKRIFFFIISFPLPL